MLSCLCRIASYVEIANIRSNTVVKSCVYMLLINISIISSIIAFLLPNYRFPFPVITRINR